MTSFYGLVKQLHAACAVISVALFILRGVWMMQDSPRLRARWASRVPPVIDTLLLLCAIVLAVMIGNYPVTHAWLTAKVLGLLAYIVLGIIALRRGRTRGQRIAAFIGALAVFAYIVSVAVTKSPTGFLALAGWR